MPLKLKPVSQFFEVLPYTVENDDKFTLHGRPLPSGDVVFFVYDETTTTDHVEDYFPFGYARKRDAEAVRDKLNASPTRVSGLVHDHTSIVIASGIG
jgi:hypothetical protein